LFFLLLCFAALTSTISLLEVPTTYMVDQLKLNRKRVVWLLALLIFILGLPTMLSQGTVAAFSKLPFYLNRDFLTFISDMCDISLTIGGCLMCIFVITTWKLSNMDKELAIGSPGYASSFTRRYLNLMIGYICPGVLGVLSVLMIDNYFGLGIFF
jgi:NSS family neurotransmitter:Na+ symporter